VVEAISAHTTTEKMQAIASTTAVRPQFATQRKTFNAKKVVAVKRDVSVKADWAIGSPENVVRIPPERRGGRPSSGHFGDEILPANNERTPGATRIDRPVPRSEASTR